MVLHPQQEKVKQFINIQLSSDGLGCLFADCLTNLNPFFGVKQIRDRADVKNIIDIFQELFVFDLCVTEQERDKLILHSYFEKDLFDVLSELRVVIIFGNLQTHRVIVCNERSQLRKGLSPAASQTNQQSTISRLSYNPQDDENMFECILKQH